MAFCLVQFRFNNIFRIKVNQTFLTGNQIMSVCLTNSSLYPSTRSCIILNLLSFNNDTMNNKIGQFHYTMPSLSSTSFFLWLAFHWFLSWFTTNFNLKVWNSACGSAVPHITAKIKKKRMWLLLLYDMHVVVNNLQRRRFRLCAARWAMSNEHRNGWPLLRDL